MTETRSRIIDAAAELIAERGYKGTSVDDVIERARLSGKSHFYHYFRSKDELGLEVLGRQSERYSEPGLASLRAPTADPMERLDRFIDALVALQTERGPRNGSPFGKLAAEMGDLHDGFREGLALILERWAAQVQALLAEARPQLLPDVDIVRLSQFIVATLEGGSMMSRVSGDSGTLREVAADLKRFLGTQRRDTAAS